MRIHKCQPEKAYYYPRGKKVKRKPKRQGKPYSECRKEKGKRSNILSCL